jgi:hypothetical protein
MSHKIAVARVTVVVLSVALLIPEAGDAQLTLRPGLYEMEIDFGIPADATNAVLDAAGLTKAGDKRRQCVTAEDLKDSGDIVKLMLQEMEDDTCKVSNVTRATTKMSFTTTCVEDGERMTWNIEMTFGPDWFSSVSKGSSSDGVAISGKVNAKRIGDCKS